MKHTHQSQSAQQSRGPQIKRQVVSTHSTRVPKLGTSAEQVTQARARAMQGAKSEFAKLMDELNQSREQNDVHERDPSLMI